MTVVVKTNDPLEQLAYEIDHTYKYKTPEQQAQVCSELVNKINQEGYYILHWLAYIGAEKVCCDLLNAGADFTVKDQVGAPPLFYTIVNSQCGTFDIFMQFDVNFLKMQGLLGGALQANMPNHLGNTPKQFAEWYAPEMHNAIVRYEVYLLCNSDIPVAEDLPQPPSLLSSHAPS